ncbi:MAG: hypothetical protein HY924_04630 [Elusimicrobia bacterium]|nr:hypothetical protein [Elusimicrobiota bacterium]
MRQLYLLPLMALFAQQSWTQSDTDCTLDGSGLEPLLADSAKSLVGKVLRKREPQALIEEADFTDGTRLKVHQGGCAHYGKRYEFSSVKDAVSPDQRKHYFEAAVRLLKRKVGPQGGSLDADLGDSIADAIKSLDAWIKKSADVGDGGTVYVWGECSTKGCSTGFACGDATCTVEVVSTGKGRVRIAASHDFPM